MKQAELERVLAQLPIGICIIDENCVVAFANASFIDPLDTGNAELCGQILFDVFETQARYLKRKIDSVFVLNNPSFSYWQQRPHVFPMRSSRPITGDESEMFQNVQFLPLTDAADIVTHVCIVVTDVTAEASYFLQQMELKKELEQEHQQLKQLHQDLQQAQQQMLHSEKMASIGQLAAGIAHEINNPIGFVRSNLDSMKEYSEKLLKIVATQKKIIKKQAEPKFLLLMDDLYERHGINFIQQDLPDLIDESLHGTTRIGNIVKSLRDFASPDDEGWSDVDLSELIQSVLVVLENEIKYKARVHLSLDTQPLLLWGKISSLRQLLLNVVLNALQAIEPMGDLMIECQLIDAEIVLTIQDSGHGIEASLLQRIFDPFFTTKEVGHGTGLGLSEVYAIAEEHQAKVDVQSEVNKGTQFEFRFKNHHA